MSHWYGWLVTAKKFSFLLLAWGVLGFLGIALVASAPSVSRLESVQVRAKNSNDWVTLGWEELGQNAGANSAEKSHLQTKYDRDTNGWLFKNISASKKVDAKTSLLDTRYIRRWALQAGDKILLDKLRLEVQQADQDTLILRDTVKNTTAQWTGTELLLDGQSGYPTCEREGIRQWAGAIRDWVSWRWLRADSKEETKLFTLGGEVPCTSRWIYTELPPDSMRFYWLDNRFWVGPGSSPARVYLERAGKPYALNAAALPMKGEDGDVKRLILGKTYYEVAAHEDASIGHYLVFTPTKNLPVFIQAEPQAPSSDPEEQRAAQKAKQDKELGMKEMAARGVIPTYHDYSWIGAASAGAKVVDGISLGLALSITLLLAAFVLRSRQPYPDLPGWLRRFGTGITVSLSIFSILLTWRGASLGTLLMLTWAISLWATVVQLLAKRLVGQATRVWLLALLLGGGGLLVMAKLAIGSENTRWLSFPQETAFWLAQICVWVSLMALAPLENVLEALARFLHPEYHHSFNLPKMRFPVSVAHWSYLLAFALAGSLLLWQGATGSEEGVGGVQPVELVKLVFVLSVAKLLWRWHELRVSLTRNFLHNFTPILMKLAGPLLVALVLGIAILMFGVHDNSPVLILGCLGLALLWLAFFDPLDAHSRGRWIGHGLIVLVLFALVAGGILAYMNPPTYDSGFPQAERLRIWSNPNLYPEAAAQLLASLQRVGEGNWWGTGWFGKNGAVMSVPAVQDDFIAAFLLNRFGGVPALLLVLLQCLWLLTLFRLSNFLQQPQVHPRVGEVFRMLGYVLYGLAWLHLIHWLISWSNVLGLLPIMGQPMTWLSAGNSHLLAIGVPTLLLALLAAWVVQMNGQKG